ncbi:hypothetical protein [Nocardioides dongkuii]|uniref:hypothetical protein n=1 Tax=Nocardioides dongkuii TaxID=2760089 RepID=UPI0015FC35A6|nr:hypothetical protein [Nocardioides dongkuii]
MRDPGHCSCCDEVAVRSGDRLDLLATQANVEARLAAGRLRVLRADVPVDQMVALLERDTKYTIVSYLACVTCGATYFWGLCIRGEPIWRRVEPDAHLTHPWSPGYPTVVGA